MSESYEMQVLHRKSLRGAGDIAVSSIRWFPVTSDFPVAATQKLIHRNHDRVIRDIEFRGWQHKVRHIVE